MDKKVLMGIGVSLLVIFAVVMAGCVTEDDTLIVGVDVTYPPYALIDEAGNVTGFDVESMQWIADQKGLKVKFLPSEWDGIIPSLQTGKIDIIYSGMSILPERAEAVAFSDPYWEVDLAVAVQEGSDVTMEQFYNGETIIGVQSGSSSVYQLEVMFGTEKYNQMVKDGKIKLYSAFTSSMEDLKNGQVETVIFDDAGIDDYIMKHPEGLVKLGITEEGEYFAVAVRKDDTELLAIINEGLAELMASEKWEELKAKYNLVEE